MVLRKDLRQSLTLTLKLSVCLLEVSKIRLLVDQNCCTSFGCVNFLANANEEADGLMKRKPGNQDSS